MLGKNAGMLGKNAGAVSCFQGRKAEYEAFLIFRGSFQGILRDGFRAIVRAVFRAVDFSGQFSLIIGLFRISSGHRRLMADDAIASWELSRMRHSHTTS